jgi:hypothetical protein
MRSEFFSASDDARTTLFELANTLAFVIFKKSETARRSSPPAAAV